MVPTVTVVLSLVDIAKALIVGPLSTGVGKNDYESTRVIGDPIITPAAVA